MKRRRRVQQNLTLEERLAAEAAKCWKEAESLPPGPARTVLERKARIAEAAAGVTQWMSTSYR